MASILLVFSLGIMLAGYLPSLPNPLYFSAMLSALLISYFFIKKVLFTRLLLACLIGVSYGVLSGYKYLSNQLANNLEAQNIVVEGKVVDLPRLDSRRQSFSFSVYRAYVKDTSPTYLANFPEKINLSSYGVLRVKTGEQWRLLVKLKRPRGFVNPQGFDYQVSLLREGIGALGYVREGPLNQLMQPPPNFSMDVLRYQLQQWLLKKSQSPQRGILVALLVGDTSFLDKLHSNEMRKTGTSHLIAISGLHIGFFAIVGFFVGNFLGRFMQLACRSFPSVIFGHLLALATAFFYSVVAGLNIPTLRTLVMLLVVHWTLALRRSFRVRDTLLVALVLVLLLDPLAAFDIGFWLSFGAVAMLIFCFSGRIVARRTMSSNREWSAVSALVHPDLWVRYFLEFVKSQWVMAVGLLVPLAVFVHSSALLAAPANLIAIPLVTFFVIPSLMLAAIFHFTFPISGSFGTVLEGFFLRCAELGLSWLHQWLQYLLGADAEKFNPLVNFSPAAALVASLSAFLILMPFNLSVRFLGFCGGLIALITPLKTLPALQLLVFDVGQGTAIFLRTPNHQMLYDTGPLYTENFDAGSALIVPYLQSQGLTHLDTLVVSHNDKDHAGGLEGILASMDVKTLLLGEPEKHTLGLDSTKKRSPTTEKFSEISSCHESKPWQWDQVTFRFLQWPLSPHAKANNHSCVLLVEYEGHKILLTGDIEKDVENALVAQESLSQVEVLLAPHHGSHSSSTWAFIAETQPDYVIYSAGFHNQFGHPHKDIQARYLAAEASPLNTAYSGAIEFNWNAGVLSALREYRHFSRRYWFDSALE